MRFYRIGDFYRNKHTDGVIQIVGDSGLAFETEDESGWVNSGVCDEERYWFMAGPPSIDALGQMLVEGRAVHYLDEHCVPCERPEWWPL